MAVTIAWRTGLSKDKKPACGEHVEISHREHKIFRYHYRRKSAELFMISDLMLKAREHRANVESLRQQLHRQAEQNNVGLGELVHVVTDYLGISQCSPCARRQMKMDKIKIPTKFVWAELVNRAKALRKPDEIAVTWIDKP